MLTHPKPQLLVLLLFFSFPPSDANKSIPHQKAEGPVRVVSLFRLASDAQIPTDHKSEPARPDTLLSPLKLNCYQCKFFYVTPPSFFWNYHLLQHFRLKCP